MVMGKVKSVTGRAITVTVDRIQLAGKPAMPLSPARSKEVMVEKTTTIHKGAAKGTKADIKAGASISVVGPNLGKGTPLVAREAAL